MMVNICFIILRSTIILIYPDRHIFIAKANNLIQQDHPFQPNILRLLLVTRGHKVVGKIVEWFLVDE